MKIHDEIVMMIENTKSIPAPIGEQSDLYADLGFDSLSFVSFLVNIEDRYSIIFDLAEMALCLKVDKLISLVEAKVKERDGHA